MKEKILAALIKRFEALKIKEEILSRFAEKLAVTTKETDDIEQVVGEVTFDRVLQSEMDSKITDANKKAVENAREKIIAEYEKSRKQDTDPPKTDGVPDWYKAVQAENQKIIDDLKSEVNGYKKQTQSESLKAKVAEGLKGKVPVSFYQNRIQIDDPEKVSEVTEQLIADFTAVKQEMVNSNLVFDKPAGSTNEKVNDGEFDSYLDEKFGGEQAAEKK
jgi:hypothetical protein